LYLKQKKNIIRCHFTGHLFYDVHDKILVCDWQQEGLGISDGTGKEMAIKPGWAWEREWEWTIGNVREWDWKDIPAYLYCWPRAP